jgi:FAD/FMN-containing dehydrogenase
MALPSFPFTEVKALTRWSNYSGTLSTPVPVFCTPDGLLDTGSDAPRALRRHGAALSAIVQYCMDTPATTLRPIGARWSFSSLLRPEGLIVDPANLNTLLKVKADWLEPEYREEQRARGTKGRTPVFVQGGARVSSINRRLLPAGLALATSGAGDGQSIAGCISTGTHGSAYALGAVHDTVLGLHLIVNANESVLLQPARAACGPEVAAWLQRETGIVTRDERDDELFAAALVGLGSLGFVHGVILETVPLYALRARVQARQFADRDLWRTLGDFELERLHPGLPAPFHFEVVLHPYPGKDKPGAFVRMYWQESADGIAHDSPLPNPLDASSDVMGLVAKFSGLLDGPLPTFALRLAIGDQLEKRFQPGERAPQLPGMLFGPTGLPPGHGTSTEVVVPQPLLRRALELLYEVLNAKAAHGEHLLGAVAVRFVPKTKAFLGMNAHDSNAYIELPSVRNGEVEGIYRAFWDALEQAKLPFTCHWGQVHGLNAQRLTNYFGHRVERWKAARADLLPSADARRVFGNALLDEVGLR